MTMEESKIFDETPIDLSLFRTSAQVTLFHSGSIFVIYRIALDGKYLLFKTSTPGTRNGAEMLRREYELSLGCEHPHIVQVLLYGELFPGKKGILMEYVDGRTLADFLHENPSITTRVRVFRELLDAVAYLHKRGIVHNDLKPENILISHTSDSLRLIDFGLSDDDAHFLIRTPGCTPLFAAPELKDNHTSDVRSDIYSIGRLMNAIFGKRFGRIAAKCTALNPDERWQSVSHLQKAFSHRKRPLKILASALLIAILAVLGVLIFNNFSGTQRNTETIRLSLSDQQDALRQQNERLTNLKDSLVELNQTYQQLTTDYQHLDTDYRTLRDSISRERTYAEEHQRKIATHIDTFKSHIAKMSDNGISAVYKAKSVGDAVANINRLTNEMHQYYLSYPKEINGEDLTFQLYPIYTAAIRELGKKTMNLMSEIQESSSGTEPDLNN